ncbi:MAG: aminomethyltransferase, partial [Hyphomicrobium sp.]
MPDTLITSALRPQLMSAGAAALAPGVERYIVKGGGTAVYALERDDTIEIALFEGGQGVEIAAFNETGKSDLGALGLKGRAKPIGITAILAGQSEDAARVRFGLFRRKLDIGRAQAAKLFGDNAPAGESLTLKAEKAAITVIGVPSDAMMVWDQNPPSDVLV